MQDLKLRLIGSYKASKLKDIKDMQLTFNALNDQLKGLDWWVSAGTALGLYREKDLIKNDDDIDIGIKSEIGRSHIELSGFKLIRKMDWKERPIQTVYLDNRNNCLIDFYYYYTDIKKGSLVTISEYGWVHFKKPYIIKPLFEIKNLHTKYGDLPFLFPIEEYLSNRYGDWKTPSNKKGRYEATL